MDNDESEVIANREPTVPIVVTSPQDGKPPSDTLKPPSSSRERSRSRSKSPRQRLRDKLEEKLEELSDSGTSGTSGTESASVRKSLQDRMFNKLFEQLIPEDPGLEDDQPRVKDRRSRKYVDRPAFSVSTMSNNFRQFNARIGVVFVLQNRLIRLFTWADASHTLSFLAVYTLVCFNPNLLAIIPLAAILFFIMVPAFLARHPSPQTNEATELYPYLGPPTAPAKYIKPAPDMSKDFFRNMRDLQNAMGDFTRIHDKAIAVMAPLTNFENEALSSTFFLNLFITSCGLFVAAPAVISYRLIILITGWALTSLGHPYVQSVVFTRETEKMLMQSSKKADKQFKAFAKKDHIPVVTPQVREVEVFELQHRELYDDSLDFEPYIFSPSPYTPLSPIRIAGEYPKGTRFFEDVQPPQGWNWTDKKWTLDLLSTEWVGERAITGVEVEMEGECWVSDIQYDEDDVPEDDLIEGQEISPDTKAKEKVRKTWEMGNGSSKKGEWRRRRWVRTVERLAYGDGRR